MTNEADYILIKDFITEARYSTGINLSAGTIELKGI